jgi:tRNA(His) guanylyltransferase
MGRFPDPTGDRMKGYELATRTVLPRRTYTVLRLDGRAFHRYTRGLDRPYDFRLMADLDVTAIAMLTDMAGAQFAYVQSDEISVLLTDFAAASTEPYFGGQVQKLVSVAASVATAQFNRLRPGPEFPLAVFDARVFTVPTLEEALAYFAWRQADAVRNAVTMAAATRYSPRELHEQPVSRRRELLEVAGIRFDGYDEGFRRGRLVHRQHSLREVTFTRGDTGEQITQLCDSHAWVVTPAPEFATLTDLTALAVPAALTALTALTASNPVLAADLEAAALTP